MPRPTGTLQGECIDLQTLWRSLDRVGSCSPAKATVVCSPQLLQDGSGRLGMEASRLRVQLKLATGDVSTCQELAPQAAATLGCFRTWIRGAALRRPRGYGSFVLQSSRQTGLVRFGLGTRGSRHPSSARSETLCLRGGVGPVHSSEGRFD